VYDVNDCPPKKALAWLKTTQLECVYVLVAGGDGTIAGVLNSIYNSNLKVLKSFFYYFLSMTHVNNKNNIFRLILLLVSYRLVQAMTYLRSWAGELPIPTLIVLT